PSLTQADLYARFEDAAMTITGHSGQLAEVPMGSLEARIPNLNHGAELFIDASAHTQGPAVAALMQASPLAGSVGKALEELQIGGGLDGQVSLHIPLASGEASVKGQVDFA